MASRVNILPQPRATSDRKDKVMSALSTSIDTINCIKDAIPNEIAKGLLSTFSGILNTVKNTIRNKEDFEELARQCYEISFLVWRAMTATPNKALSLPVTRAIGDLKKSVDGVKDVVGDRSQAGIASRVISVTVDKEKIAGWQRDLSRFLQIFNTELNILTHVKLEEIKVMFEQSHLQAETETTAQGILPPGKPSLFVGRDNLVHDVSGLLTQSRHVALLGTGGIGKSCLAKAVLNEPEIVAKFGAQRFFIRYDDMDASQVSYDVFLDRIIGTLGLALPVGGVDRLSVISARLSSPPSLLILDNAETFLDAVQDKTRITDAVDNLGALASTVILLTTRSRALPSNILWNAIAVPALDPIAAREAFAAVYHKPIEKIDVIDSLLQSLDCHPLSINLLAHAARENDWSLTELLNTWNQQQIELLHNGDGKSQSLIVTLELSLNSLSLKKLGDSVLHVLQIIAFLPQGIDRREISGLFPSLPSASTIVDATCKQSITYRSGDFVTMLAPVRLYISMAYNKLLPHRQSISLLPGIRAYYRDRLETRGAGTCGDIMERGGWISEEVANAERMVSLELTLFEDVQDACAMCVSFLYHLQLHDPRPTALRTLIEAIPTPHAALPKHGRYLKLRKGIRSLVSRRDTRCDAAAALVVEGKGRCLHALSSLAHMIDGCEAMFDLLKESYKLYSSIGKKTLEALCLSQIGERQHRWGQMAASEKSFQEAADALRCAPENARDKTDEAHINWARGAMMVHKGEMEQARLLFELADRACKSEDQPNGAMWGRVMSIRIIREYGYIELWLGNYDSSRAHFSEAIAQARHWGYIKSETTALFGLFEVEIRNKNFVEAVHLSDQAYKLTYGTDLILEAVYYRACLLADEGSFDDSRDQLNDLSEQPLEMENTFYYLMGRTELLSGNYNEAHAYFSTFMENCEANDLIARARGLRALGEVALSQRNHELATTLFSDVEKQRKEMCMSAEAMYYAEAYWMIPANIDGWTNFRATNI